MGFFEFLQKRSDDMVTFGLQHLMIVAIAVVASTVLGIGIGVLAFRVPRLRGAALGITGTLLTVPSFAFFVLLLPVVGLGTPPVVIALTLYGLMPIVRNTITGLTEVDPAVVESAQGMGMSAAQRLTRIQLPIAWPVILAGVRVTTVMLVGIAAIGSIVLGPGYGVLIFDGLGRVGSPVGLNMVLAGILGVVIVAIIFDGLFALVGKLTTSKGLR
ncbi:ABC transporter permease [Cumulibacter manganitolerans]|uniref:ABC transporter permease n=1 Tax=Cumulibacter manganitolerans TaxID=1884992 RepID=UPI0012971849|nr:ABC transporter permease [Cumulibacter manganitolerans]